jgi:hypothetical protein
MVKRQGEKGGDKKDRSMNSP